MTDLEIKTVITLILEGEGSDEEIGDWIEKISWAIPCPNILNIVRSATEADNAETILRKARQYKPFQL